MENLVDDYLEKSWSDKIIKLIMILIIKLMMTSGNDEDNDKSKE